MITEFVIDRVERSFGSSFNPSSESEEGGVATLPSIQEFVRHREGPAAGNAEFVQRTSRSPWGTYEAKHEVSGTAAEVASVPAREALTADLLLDRHTPHSGSQDAVVNDVVEPADAWAASAAPTRADRAPSEAAEEPSSEAAAAPFTAAPEVWVAEERDAFDWHAAANLAVPPAEAQRAADEWSSTEWNRSSGSVQDHVATLLVQISRRVRSGELEVQASKQMGAEAALVAALSALLSESARK